QDVLSSPDGRRVNRRIRGDSGLRYDDEVIRLVDESRHRFDLPLHDVVITSLPDNLSPENEDYVEQYKEKLSREGIAVASISKIKGYPLLTPGLVGKTLTANEQPSSTDHTIVVSPGGGSGKFGVAITDIAH